MKKTVIIILLISILSCGCFGCYYVANASELSFKISDEKVINMPLPKGILPSNPETVNLGKLFQSPSDFSFDTDGNELHAEVFVGYEELNKGVVYLKISEAAASKLRVVILPSKTPNDQKMNRFYREGYYALTFGSGEYSIYVFHKICDREEFAPVFEATFAADFEELEPYRYATVYSSYHEESLVAKKAYELTYDLTSTEEKAEKILRFLRRNIRIDQELMQNIDSVGENIYDADVYYENKKGVCYHFAALFSAMAKSVGIPAREVRGYTDDSGWYHSWNEYYSEENGWVTADAMLKNLEYYKEDYSER